MVAIERVMTLGGAMARQPEVQILTSRFRLNCYHSARVNASCSRVPRCVRATVAMMEMEQSSRPSIALWREMKAHQNGARDDVRRAGFVDLAEARIYAA